MLGAALLVWLAFLAAAVVLGAARDSWLRPRIGERTAHQVGTLCVCVADAAIIAWFDGRHRPSVPEAAGLGFGWVAMGMAFEFAFFGWFVKRPWSELWADYDLRRGRLLPVLWLTILVASPLCAALGDR